MPPDPMDVADDPAADDDDPITASYQVFLNPALPLGRRLLVLQQPNRTDNSPRPPPSEMRLKASAGMVEVDIPVDSTAAYDREKGLRWGRSLQTSMALKNGGSHGLAGGFGLGAVQQRSTTSAPGRKRNTTTADHDDDDDAALDWNEAVRQGKVLSTQTLGGQYPDAAEVQHMVGVFHGRELHLTPVSSLVLLRPQLHHLDAAAQLERQQASAGGGSGGKDAAGAPAARAIHMTIKTAADADGVSTETMADRLRAVQAEPWRKMRYTDENDEAAWEVYNDSLFLRSEGQDDGALEERVPALGTRWAGERFLEAVSGITKPEEVVVEVDKVKTEAGTPAMSLTPAVQDVGRIRARGGARRGRARPST